MNLMDKLQLAEGIKVGPKGEIANARLIDHTDKFNRKLHKVTDGVYHLVGVRNIANPTMIEGKTGMIIIDTGATIDDAEAHLEEFRKVTDKPVSAIIYTHFHYTKGATAYVEKGHEDSVEIWGHEKLHHNYTNRRSEVFSTYVRRIAIQMGNFLPTEGPDSPPNAGLGGGYETNLDRYGYLKPNRTVSEPMETEIDGVRFKLIPAISDSDDVLTIWLPDYEVVVENIVWRVLPNFGAIRGEFYRDPMQWGKSVDDIRALNAKHLLGVHGVPISGYEEVSKALQDYRDAIQFVYDQTIRGINKGLSPDEMIEMIKLPKHLEESEVLGQFYGEFPFAIRGVYSGVMGWYGNDTATLHPVSRKVEGEKIIKGFGGLEEVMKQVKEALRDKEFSWAAQLVTYVLKADPDHSEAKLLKASALRELSRLTTASITRNYYLTQALELEGQVNSFDIQTKSKDKVLIASPGTYINLLRFELIPEKAEQVNKLTNFHFTDLDVHFGLHVRHGVAEFIEGKANNPDIEIGFTLEVWADLVAGNIKLDQAIEKNLIVIQGESEQAKEFFALFENGI